MVHGLYPVLEAGSFNCLFQFPFSHFACTFAILTSNRHYKWRNRSARLMFEDKEGSISLKASKRKLQNKSHWTHILTNFWWNRRALHFKTMCVRYCKTNNKGFNYISCILFTQEENHTYLKSQVLSSPKTALFPIILTQIMTPAFHSTQVIVPELCWFYHQSIFWIHSLFSTLTAIEKVRAFILSVLDRCTDSRFPNWPHLPPMHPSSVHLSSTQICLFKTQTWLCPFPLLERSLAPHWWCSPSSDLLSSFPTSSRTMPFVLLCPSTYPSICLPRLSPCLPCFVLRRSSNMTSSSSFAVFSKQSRLYFSLCLQVTLYVFLI